VTSLTASLYISETQLRRRCRTAVGLASKARHRMLRFQGFLALVQQAIAQRRAPADDGLALSTPTTTPTWWLAHRPERTPNQRPAETLLEVSPATAVPFAERLLVGAAPQQRSPRWRQGRGPHQTG
jgi:hypothetical protein